MKKILTLITICLVMSGCSSETLVRHMYGKLGDSFVDGINDYADFDKSQKLIIDNAGQELAKWHRDTQLPIYREALESAARNFAADKEVNKESVLQLVTTMEEAGRAMSEYPIFLLDDLVTSMTSEQISQLERSLEDEIEDARKEVKKVARRGGAEHQQQEFTEDFQDLFESFLEVDLNAEQNARIEQLSKEFWYNNELKIELEEQWNVQFVSLLRGSAGGDVSPELRDHLRLGADLMAHYKPEESKQNTQRIIDAFYDLIVSMDDEQRANLSLSLSNYADLLTRI